MTARQSRIGRVLAALVAATAALPSTAEAVDVVVRAAPHDGYGRIVFNWQQPVSKEVSVDDGRLTVRFGAPIESDYRSVIRVLRDYVSDARPGADGQSVSFRLLRGVEADSFYSGTAVVVDLRPTAPDAAPEAEPATAPPAGDTAVSSRETRGAGEAASANARRINVRAGVHPTYTRIVFDWDSRVGYQLDNAAGVVTIRFDEPASFRLGQLAQRPPARLGAVRAATDGEGARLTIAVPRRASVRHFRAGSRVVVDIRTPDPGDEPVALPSETATAAATAGSDATPANRTEATPAPPAATEAAPTQAAESTVAEVVPSVDAPAPAEAESDAPPGATPPSGPGLPPEPERAVVDGGTTESGGGDAESSNAPPAAGAAAAAAAARPRALQPAASLQPAPAAAPKEEVAVADLGAVASATETGKAELRFPWQEPVAAAVFFRGDRLWIAFDRAAKLDPAAVEAAGGGTIQGVRVVPAEGGLVLVMDVARNIQPTLKRDGNAWIIELKQDRFRLASPIPVQAQPDAPVGPRLFLPIAAPGNPIAVTDPDVGDNLVIVPVVPLSNGIPTEYRYPQLELARSAQGVAVAPKIDDLRIRTTRQGIEIMAGRELAVSAVGAGAEASARLEAFRPLTRVVPEDTWAKLAVERRSHVTPRRQALEIAAAESGSAAALEQARFALARFLVANSYGAEALGVMRMMTEARPEVAEEAEFRLMRGIAKYLLARYAEAAGDFGHPSLDRNDEGAFWRAANRAKAGALLTAARDLQLNGAIPQVYPRPLRTALGTLVAEAAIEVGDPTLAENTLEAVALDDPDARETAYIRFVEARLEEYKGNFDAAVGLWEEVMVGDDRWMRARSTIARTELLLKLQRLPIPEAIEAFESLRFVWRDDLFEFRLLRRLGNLYLDEGMYREGLSTLRQAATHFREHPEAPQVTQKMADTFNELFLKGGAERLPPVAAIALYNEFKELTPVGDAGDRMIQLLADRLVEVDLLDRAAALLQSQVQFRLDGVERSRVGARLALIRILSEEYAQAIETLDGTRAADEAPALANQRRHLRARALIGLGFNTEALALLEEDESRDAELLRIEVYWDAGDWRSAAQALNRLLRLDGARPEEPLDRRQASAVLNYAVALTLSGGERALQRVRRDYGPAMQATQFADAFSLITNPAPVGLLTPSEVPSEVAEAQSFLTTYRNKLKSGRPLSAIN